MLLVANGWNINLRINIQERFLAIVHDRNVDMLIKSIGLH